MDTHQDILNNLNTKYVLLKNDSKDNNPYFIIDKTRKTMVMINDPIINKDALIRKMIDKNVEIFYHSDGLPTPTQVPFPISSVPNTIQIFIKKIYDKQGEETGAIISAMTSSKVDINEKKKIEKIIENYAFDVLYPNEGLSIYSNIYSDTVSITIIKDINDIPSQDISVWKKAELYEW